MRTARPTVLLAALLAQVGLVSAHETGQHYHLPGPMEATSVEPALVVGLVAINAVVWLLALRATQRFVGD